ncbi:MAG TPA: hypothetical protein VM204_06950 [Gaiellaceae bacterium]|nr:hypothetical protein [Gaiellaceae bacterium]
MSAREAWIGVVQDADGNEETELVTLDGAHAEPGATIELTDGQRITLTAPAVETPEQAAAA